MAKHLPVIQEQESSLHSDGRRKFVHPADVAGRFTSLRNVVFAVLIVVYALLPFIRIGGAPAVFLDIANSRFHLFGATFNANDFWLVFFLITGIGFALIVVTTLFGRVWCGYACPQTVFMEGVFRKIERLIDGPRAERMKRAAGKMTLERAARGVLKHTIFIVLCLLLGHILLSYFVSLPSMLTMVSEPPTKNLEAFLWIVGFSGITYFNFAWFREQVCLIVCPYGRLQSAMTDRDTLVIGYDTTRGEPRGKATDPSAGDCVDCRRCVVVCPTGIDIRNGLQIDCIGCAACVDACDEVMTKLDRPTGLVRYDSENGFSGSRAKFLRPRLFFYVALGIVGLAVAIFAGSTRVAFEGHLLRSAGAVFVATDTDVANPVRLHVVNKRSEPLTLEITNKSDQEIVPVGLDATVTLEAGEARYIPIMLRVTRENMRPGLRARFQLQAAGEANEKSSVELPFLGPVRRSQ